MEGQVKKGTVLNIYFPPFVFYCGVCTQIKLFT